MLFVVLSLKISFLVSPFIQSGLEYLKNLYRHVKGDSHWSYGLIKLLYEPFHCLNNEKKKKKGKSLNTFNTLNQEFKLLNF